MIKLLSRLNDVLEQMDISVEDIERLYNNGNPLSAAECLHYAREYRKLRLFDNEPNFAERLKDYKRNWYTFTGYWAYEL